MFFSLPLVSQWLLGSAIQQPILQYLEILEDTEREGDHTWSYMIMCQTGPLFFPYYSQGIPIFATFPMACLCGVFLCPGDEVRWAASFVRTARRSGMMSSWQFRTDPLSPRIWWSWTWLMQSPRATQCFDVFSGFIWFKFPFKNYTPMFGANAGCLYPPPLFVFTNVNVFI